MASDAVCFLSKHVLLQVFDPHQTTLRGQITLSVRLDKALLAGAGETTWNVIVQRNVRVTL